MLEKTLRLLYTVFKEKTIPNLIFKEIEK